MGRLSGRTAIVTGASRGIGEAIAAAFAREGARVVVASRKAEGVEAAASRINAEVEGAAVPLTCHVGQVEALGAFYERVVAEVGVPDVLVNNAATNPYFGPSLELEWAAWDKTFEVNLKGPFELTRLVTRRLIAEKRTGSVINMSSIFGTQGAPGQSIYAMTKAALISLTQTLAHELGPAGVRVNCIAPGLIQTRFAQAILERPELLEPYNARAALSRPGLPAEVAGAAVYLASEEASYLTGQTLHVDGGYAVG
jgi:NAD(P)-dependent dehydrogenase (short-subunit alcohol dehydrogenase family)